MTIFDSSRTDRSNDVNELIYFSHIPGSAVVLQLLSIVIKSLTISLTAIRRLFNVENLDQIRHVTC